MPCQKAGRKKKFLGHLILTSGDVTCRDIDVPVKCIGKINGRTNELKHLDFKWFCWNIFHALIDPLSNPTYQHLHSLLFVQISEGKTRDQTRARVKRWRTLLPKPCLTACTKYIRTEQFALQLYLRSPSKEFYSSQLLLKVFGKPNRVKGRCFHTLFNYCSFG